MTRSCRHPLDRIEGVGFAFDLKLQNDKGYGVNDPGRGVQQVPKCRYMPHAQRASPDTLSQICIDTCKCTYARLQQERHLPKARRLLHV